MVKGATTAFDSDDLDYNFFFYNPKPVWSCCMSRATLWHQNQLAPGHFRLQNLRFCDNVSPADPAAARAPQRKTAHGPVATIGGLVLLQLFSCAFSTLLDQKNESAMEFRFDV